MKAVVLTGYGGVENLELREVPDPVVGPNQIKVRMAGASINPVDWKLRSGVLKALMPLQFPAILGRDASGVVSEVGTDVTGFKLGDQVLGRANASYAELVVAEKDAWVSLPAGMDLVEAGALPLVLLTGAQLVEETIGVREGERLLVTGALGSVGRVAVFVAKSHGAKVYAGVRRSQKTDAAKLEVEGVVALEDEFEIRNLPQLDCIADTVGGDVGHRVLPRLKREGRIGSVVGESAEAKARGLTVLSMMTHLDAKRLAQLAQAVAQKKFVIPIVKRFPLSQAREAQQLAEKGAGGKVILTA